MIYLKGWVQIAPILIYNEYKLRFFVFSKPNKHKHFKNKLKIIVKKCTSY